MSEQIVDIFNLDCECSICLENIDGVSNKVVTDCGHTFHCKCLMTNVSFNGFGCPFCRNKKERYRVPDNTPEEKFKKFETTPVFDREMEHFINPIKPSWQSRYYQGLFGLKENVDEALKREISINYLQGLEWTMKYYTTGCPDWRWKYKYNYPPLLQDLIKHIPLFNTEFVPYCHQNPVSEIVQLCYVLPRASLPLLPKRLYFELIKKYEHWYKGNCDFVWAYCRYFWESHVDMNEIDIDELENFIDDNKHLLSS